ncbi:hypothetical protein, partial [Lysinibacillus xylanilyticus]|uniref:hypothetical protein n=1 Tax=Lysinibacillus xylanilyticus TaxID=582475 RepID=UPI003D08F200
MFLLIEKFRNDRIENYSAGNGCCLKCLGENLRIITQGHVNVNSFEANLRHERQAPMPIFIC